MKYSLYISNPPVILQNQIKAQAREHERFRRICVSFAQTIHRVDMRLRLGSYQTLAAEKRAAREAEAQARKHKPQIPTVKTEAQVKAEEAAEAKAKEKPQDVAKPPPPRIRPLTEAKAIDSGANILSEAFLFLVAGGLIIFESMRARRKEASRKLDVSERLDELEESERAAHRGLLALEKEVLHLRAQLEKRSQKDVKRILPKELWHLEEEDEEEAEAQSLVSRLFNLFRFPTGSSANTEEPPEKPETAPNTSPAHNAITSSPNK